MNAVRSIILSVAAGIVDISALLLVGVSNAVLAVIDSLFTNKHPKN
jgi:hypothetical protein